MRPTTSLAAFLGAALAVGQANAQPAEDGAADCARIPGSPVPTGERLTTEAPSGDFSVALPGNGWCAVQVADLRGTAWMRATPRGVPLVLALARPAPFPAARPYPTPEALLAAVRAPGRAAEPELAIWQETLRGLRLLGAPATLSYDLTPGEPRCVRARGTTRPARGGGDTRRFALEMRLCLAPAGQEAAALLAVLRGIPAAERSPPAEADATAEAFFASLQFPPATAELSPACQPVQREFARLLPDCAARLGVRPEPGGREATAVATGCLAGTLRGSALDAPTQRRCHAEVLRAAGFRDALPLEPPERPARP